MFVSGLIDFESTAVILLLLWSHLIRAVGTAYPSLEAFCAALGLGSQAVVCCSRGKREMGSVRKRHSHRDTTK